METGLAPTATCRLEHSRTTQWMVPRIVPLCCERLKHKARHDTHLPHVNTKVELSTHTLQGTLTSDRLNTGKNLTYPNANTVPIGRTTNFWPFTRLHTRRTNSWITTVQTLPDFTDRIHSGNYTRNTDIQLQRKLITITMDLLLLLHLQYWTYYWLTWRPTTTHILTIRRFGLFTEDSIVRNTAFCVVVTLT